MASELAIKLGSTVIIIPFNSDAPKYFKQWLEWCSLHPELYLPNQPDADVPMPTAPLTPRPITPPDSTMTDAPPLALLEQLAKYGDVHRHRERAHRPGKIVKLRKVINHSRSYNRLASNQKRRRHQAFTARQSEERHLEHAASNANELRYQRRHTIANLESELVACQRRGSFLRKQLGQPSSNPDAQAVPNTQARPKRPTRQIAYRAPRGGQAVLSGPTDVLESMEHPCTAAQFGHGFVDDWHVDSFDLGEVILAPWYSPNFDQNVSLSQFTTAYSSSVGTICAKLRPFIVVAKLPDGMMCMPLSTYGGDGVWKLSDYKKEFMYRVKSGYDDDVFWSMVPQSSYVTTWPRVEESTLYRGWEPRPNTYIDMSRTWCIEGKTPVRRMGAMLDPADIRRCVDACYHVVETGVTQLLEHENAQVLEAQSQFEAREKSVRELPYERRADIIR